MADNVYNLKFTLSNGNVIDAGQITAPQGPKGDKGDSADIPYSSSTPFMDGVGSIGSATTVARGDHRHPSDTSRQEKLVSGENIKTINGQSVLGSGDIPISGGSEYANTSEIVDNAITLTSTSTLTDLATQILAQKTKVCRVGYGENTMDTLARLYELFNISNAYDAPSYTFEYFFKVLSSDDYIELECSGGGLAAFFRGGITRYYNGTSEPPYGAWKAIPLISYVNPYPVGSIYLSTFSTSPSSLFGGTWEQIKDVFLLAAGDTYTAGSTGGSANAVVVRHGGHVKPSDVDSGSIATADWEVAPNSSNSYFMNIDKLGAYGDRRAFTKEFGNEVGFRTLYKGESGTGKNMPPYLTVYMWERIL